MNRLLLDAEQAVSLHPQHLDRVSRAVVAALLAVGDEAAYRQAKAEVRTVPAAGRWLVELTVEAELAANGVPLRNPSGLRW